VAAGEDLSVEFGLTMPTHGLLLRDEQDFFLQKLPASEMRPVEVAQLAERGGYHSVWFSDHVCMGRDEGAFHTANTSGTRAYPNRPVMMDLIATMGAVAATTSRLRIAPSVWVAPYRHPLSAAHQLATVDVLSNGRLIVGVGSGWDPQEFAAMGADFDRRGSVTEECIEIFKHAWTEPWLDFHGQFYEIVDVSMEPKPVQRPHPPVIFGTITERGARRAARVAGGMYPMFLDSYGDPFRFDRLREAALREGERIGRDLSGFRMAAFCSGLVTAPDDPLTAREPRMTLTGSAEQVIRDIERFAAAGYSHLTMHFDVRSGTITEYLEIVQRFAEEVIPAARDIDSRPFV
jgi:probable F420-dependent oxidoreductase